MPKSKVILEAINGEVPLEQTLRRLAALANDIDNDELSIWAEHELTGYRDAKLPSYRIVSSLSFSYSGINTCLNVSNASLSISLLDKETVEGLKEIAVKEPISSIYRSSTLGPVLHIDRSFLATEVSRNSGSAIRCTQIKQNIPAAAYETILAEVTNRSIKALTLLEEQYGSLDDLGLTVSSPRAAALTNANINKLVLDLGAVPQAKESTHSKFVWNVVAPIVTGILVAVIGAYIMNRLGIQN